MGQQFDTMLSTGRRGVNTAMAVCRRGLNYRQMWTNAMEASRRGGRGVRRSGSSQQLLSDLHRGGDLSRWEPELCIQMLRIPAAQNYGAIKKLLQRATEEWLLEFLDRDGLGVLLESLELQCEQRAMSVSDALTQTQCVQCIRAAINSNAGLQHIVERRDYVRKLATALESQNTTVKMQVLELLCAVCKHSVRGHSMALDALQHLKVTRGKRYRFDILLQEIRSSENTAYRTLVLSFINCLVLCCTDLMKRIRIRNEFLGLGIAEILSSLRDIDDEYLQIQLTAFYKHQSEDEDELEETDQLTHHQLFDTIFKKIADTPQASLFHSMLLSLSQLDPTNPNTDAVWSALEEISAEALESGCSFYRNPVTTRNVMARQNYAAVRGSSGVKRWRSFNLPQSNDLSEVCTVSTQTDSNEVSEQLCVENKEASELSYKEQVQQHPEELQSEKLQQCEEQPASVTPIPPPPPPMPNHQSTTPPPPPIPCAANGKLNGVPPPPPIPIEAFGETPVSRRYESGYRTCPTRHSMPADLTDGTSTWTPPSEKCNTLPLPKRKMKTLNWTKIPSRSIGESVWTEMQNKAATVKIDFKKMEELFCQRTVNVKRPVSSPGKISSPVVIPEVNLLDRKRSLAVNIFLKQFKTGGTAVIKAIETLNKDDLDVEKLKVLMRLLPDEKELKIISDYEGDKNRLGVAEKFYLQLSKVPAFALRVEAMLLKEEIPAKLAELKPQLQSVVDACKKLTTNEHLKEFLGLVLQLGNFINAGSYAGNAAGFKLNTLPKLFEVRSNDRGLTFLHYIVGVAEENNKQILKFTQDMSNMKELGRMPLELLQDEVQKVITDVKHLESQLKKDKNGIRPHFKDFLKMALKSIDELQQDLENAKASSLSLAKHFCEDPTKFKPEECFGLFADFFKKIENAQMDNERLRKEEERRRKYEEEQIKEKGNKSRGRKFKRTMATDGFAVVRRLLDEIQGGNYKLRPTFAVS